MLHLPTVPTLPNVPYAATPPSPPIPPPAVVGHDIYATNFTSISLTIPITASPGDVLVAFWGVNHQATPTPPAGLTLIDTASVGGSFSGYLFKRIIDVGDPGSTLTFTTSTAQKQGVGLVVFSGVTDVDSFDQYITSSSTDTHPTPDITPTTDSVIVSFFSEKSSSPSTYFTPPTGLDNHDTAFNQGGGAISVGLAYDDDIEPANTLFSPGDWVAENATGSAFAFTVAIESAGGTPPPPAPFSIDGGDSTTTVFDDALDGDLPHNDTLDGGDSNGN